jgi:hypothetical protein
MTDCTALRPRGYFDFGAYYIVRRMIRQARTLAIVAIATILIASILGWEAPENPKCDPNALPLAFVLTQPTSLPPIMPGCPLDLKNIMR